MSRLHKRGGQDGAAGRLLLWAATQPPLWNGQEAVVRTSVSQAALHPVSAVSLGFPWSAEDHGFRRLEPALDVSLQTRSYRARALRGPGHGSGAVLERGPQGRTPAVLWFWDRHTLIQALDAGLAADPVLSSVTGELHELVGRGHQASGPLCPTLQPLSSRPECRPSAVFVGPGKRGPLAQCDWWPVTQQTSLCDTQGLSLLGACR